MSDTHPYNQFVTRFVFPDNLDNLKILDCACGRGAWGFFIRSQIEGVPYLEGFDLYVPYIKKLKELGLYDSVYVMDIRAVETLGERFDIILAFDVLEHLEYDEAVKTLRDLENMCDRLLIVSFPIGFQSQDVGYDGNSYQIHKSSFQPKELKKWGYEVRRFDRHTKTVRVFERIRCLIFGLEFNPGRFVAWRRFS